MNKTESPELLNIITVAKTAHTENSPKTVRIKNKYNWTGLKG